MIYTAPETTDYKIIIHKTRDGDGDVVATWANVRGTIAGKSHLLIGGVTVEFAREWVEASRREKR